MSCSSRKRAFTTAAKARVEAAREAKAGALPLAIYRCPMCRCWHMTKQLVGPGARVAGGRRFRTEEG